MRIGVVCEGPTDFHAINSFFGHSLSESGIEVKFQPLQPEMDATSHIGGWSNVLLWLNKHPPATRIQQFFAGGLFGGALSAEPLDGLLIQVDSDVLSQISFSTFVRDNYGYVSTNPSTTVARASEIRHILSLAARLSEMTIDDVNRHVLAPAVESTEAWCVAAFTTPTSDFEILSGQTLIDAFMCALEISESRIPSPPYAEINKSQNRRKRFCKTYSNFSGRILTGCQQFHETHDKLASLA